MDDVSIPKSLIKQHKATVEKLTFIFGCKPFQAKKDTATQSLRCSLAKIGSAEGESCSFQIWQTIFGQLPCCCAADVNRRVRVSAVCRTCLKTVCCGPNNPFVFQAGDLGFWKFHAHRCHHRDRSLSRVKFCETCWAEKTVDKSYNLYDSYNLLVLSHTFIWHLITRIDKILTLEITTWDAKVNRSSDHLCRSHKLFTQKVVEVCFTLLLSLSSEYACLLTWSKSKLGNSGGATPPLENEIVDKLKRTRPWNFADFTKALDQSESNVPNSWPPVNSPNSYPRFLHLHTVLWSCPSFLESSSW